MNRQTKLGPQDGVLAGRSFPPDRPARTAVLILNYDGLEDCKRLAHALKRSEDQGFDVYLIDNNSPNLAITDIVEALPDFHVLQSPTNLGYAGGNNLGLALIEPLEYEFVWILNPDMIPQPDTLSSLIAGAEDHPEHMIFGSVLVHKDRPEKAMSAGSICDFSKVPKIGNLYSGTPLEDLPKDPFEAVCVPGCSIFLRKAVLADIGHLPEQYFLYFEETHWLYEASQKGYPCLILPHIVQVHDQNTRSSDLPLTHYFYYYLRGSMLLSRHMNVKDLRVSETSFQSKFIAGWMKRIAATAPEKCAFYERLAGRALADGRAGLSGPIDIDALEKEFIALDTENGASPAKALIVLGMHRSGTSALAGVLSILSQSMIKTSMKTGEDNPKGFFESRSAYKLNEAMLADAGSCWDDCTSIPPSWFDGEPADIFRTQATEVIAQEFEADSQIVIKDPRICRLLPLWQDALIRIPYRPAIVHVHRNPIEVANSLKSRNGMDLALGQMIWLRHVLDAEHYSRKLPRHFVSYRQLLSNWHDLAMGVQNTLGVRLPLYASKTNRQVKEFLTTDLQHHDLPAEAVFENPDVSKWVKDAFDILERWSEHGEDPADHGRLDHLRSEFEKATAAFGKMTNTMRQTTAKLEHKVADLSDENEGLSDKVADLCDRIEALNDETEVLISKEKTLLKQVAKTEEALTQRTQEAAETAKSLNKVQAELASQRALAEEVPLLSEIIRRRDTSVAARQREVSCLTLKLAAQERKREAEREELAKLEWRLSDSKQRLSHSEASDRHNAERAAHAEAEVHALRSSTSWRLTGPVRYLVRLGRQS